MLINADKLVWAGRRIDNRDEAWQMPQGGLDKGEDSWAGALRELEEETGIRSDLVERIGVGRVRTMLGSYAAGHWLAPMATVSDFRAAVAAAGVDVPSFDPDAWLDRWRIGPEA